jgi:hypothetical protein
VSGLAAPAEFLAWLDGYQDSGRAPAPGLPGWLAQLAIALFQGQVPDAARTWAARLHAGVASLGGQIPFRVVHDWHVSTVVPLAGELDGAGVLHARALAGDQVTAGQWIPALEPALRQLYLRAYAYEEAWWVNYDSALAYGLANGFGEESTLEYAAHYANLATGANRQAFADANAVAGAAAQAAAYTGADPAAYAAACPYATARAYARAAARSDREQKAPEPDPAGRSLIVRARAEREQAAYAVLADGLAASLERAASLG